MLYLTVVPGSKPEPEISTGVPTGPEVDKENGRVTKGVTVNVFEAELDP